MPYRTSTETAQRKAEMRGRLLAAALELFASQGYAATTMQQIVKAAGTSIGNCYFYFPDKAALLMALAEESSVAIGAAIDEAIGRVTPGPAQLVVAIYTSVVTLLEQPELARVVLVEGNQPHFRAAIMAFFTARIARVFTATPALIRGADPRLAAHAWQGAAFNVLDAVLTGPAPVEPQAVARFLARWNVQALGLPAPVVEQAFAELDGMLAAQDASAASAHDRQED